MLLDLGKFVIEIICQKGEIYVDLKQFETSIKAIFSNKFEKIEHFERFLDMIVESLSKFPPKKQSIFVSAIVHRPGNFLFIS